MTDRGRRLFVLLLLSGFVGSVLIWNFLVFLMLPAEESAVFLIEKGVSVQRVAQQLEEKRVISSSFWFSLLVRLRGGIVQAGAYRFSAGEMPLQILTRLQRGDVVQHKLTIPEGWTLRDIGDFLRRRGWREAPDLLAEKKLSDFLDRKAASLEGWLYPATYDVFQSASAFEIIARMTLQMQQVLQDEWEQRPKKTVLKTPYQALILASMIEKEAGVPEERDRISAVFHNRMRRNMRLQSDPTVIYGLVDFNGDLTRKDLKRSTPYNTYRHKGLPPTPICNPGRASIHAALHPDPDASEELYFVAKGDGTHLFSKTFQRHKQGVRRYQKKAADLKR